MLMEASVRSVGRNSANNITAEIKLNGGFMTDRNFYNEEEWRKLPGQDSIITDKEGWVCNTNCHNCTLTEYCGEYKAMTEADNI